MPRVIHATPATPGDRPAAGPATRGEGLAVVLLGSALAVSSLLFVAVRCSMTGINDFGREAWPPYRALLAGHVLHAIQISPGYVGSLLLRAPFALLAGAFGGGERAVYFAAALPCVIAATVLAAWLATDARRRTGRARTLGPIVFCGINPIIIIALFGGHPEEILGASLCVAAVLAGDRRRPGLAGLLLGLAIVNKSWGLAAAPAVLVAMPAGQRRAALTAAGVSLALLGPLVLVRSLGGAAQSGTGLGSGVGTIFLNPQLLWWFGRGSWIVDHAHVLIVLVAWAACAAWWLARRRRQPGVAVGRADALLLLAFVMLLRCALDPWDNTYYHLPFLFAIMAYETGRRPWLSALFTVLLLIVVPQQWLQVSASAHALLYALVSVPTLLVLARRLYLPSSANPTSPHPTSPGRGASTPPSLGPTPYAPAAAPAVASA